MAANNLRYQCTSILLWVRKPLLLLAILLFPMMAWCNAAVVTEDAADTVLLNGRVYGQRLEQALAIKGQRIVFVGSNQAAEQWIGAQTEVLDLQQQLLLPGFVDNHNHLGEGGEVNCELRADRSLRQQQRTLQQCKSALAPGEWLIGYGSQLEIELGFAETPRSPLPFLDSLFPNNPVIIMEHSSHAMFANSLALQAAGIGDRTPDPQGGKIMRDWQGQAIGVLVDSAGDLVMELAVNALANKEALLVEGILWGLEEARKAGITTVGDGRTYWRRGMLKAWQQVAKADELTARVSLRPWIYPHIAMAQQLPALRRMYQGDLNQLLIVTQVKMYNDGVPENGTAKMRYPYSDTWFPESPKGLNYIGQQPMTQWLQALAKLGFGAHIHALGDAGIHETLNAIASVRKNGSAQPYHITHLSLVDPRDIARFAPLQVVADLQLAQPLYSAAQRQLQVAPFIGKKRAAQLLYRPVKALQKAGATVVLSSDWSVLPMSPLLAIAYAVQEGSLDIHQAIAAYTINPAKALSLEDITGSIAVGKSADLVLLDRDITQIPARSISKAKVVGLWLQGEPLL